MSFLFGLAVGVIIGGHVVDINLRAPAPLKQWFASWFSAAAKPEAGAKK